MLMCNSFYRKSSKQINPWVEWKYKCDVRADSYMVDHTWVLETGNFPPVHSRIIGWLRQWTYCYVQTTHYKSGINSNNKTSPCLWHQFRTHGHLSGPCIIISAFLLIAKHKAKAKCSLGCCNSRANNNFNKMIKW